MATKSFNTPPICLRCLRRSTTFTLPSSAGASLIQARGKKTNTSGRKHKGVLVRLLGNIPKFGPKHSVMRVAPGRMRNGWFAGGRAEYMTRARMSELNVSPESIIMPDPLYMPVKKSLVDDSSVKENGLTGNATLDLRTLLGYSGREPQAAKPAGSDNGAGHMQNMLDRMLRPEPVERVEIKRVSPTRARTILDTMVPQRMLFIRQANPAHGDGATETKIATLMSSEDTIISSDGTVISPNEATVDAAAAAAADTTPESAVPAPATTTTAGPASQIPPTAIFGSVTVTDISNGIRSILAADAEASRINVEPRYIRFIGPEMDGLDRVRTQGLFDIEIALPNIVPLRRRILVVASEPSNERREPRSL